MSKKAPMNEITCPYCFKQFSHSEVHYRLRSMSKTSFRNTDESAAENAPIRDAEYIRFWKRFSDNPLSNDVDDCITEQEPEGSDFRGKPYEIRVVNPNSSTDAGTYLKTDGNGKGEKLKDANGMCYGVTDKNGIVSRDRVCPHCHNPLPRGYGKYNTLFVSVIGIMSSGKTVYLSQLLKYLPGKLPELTGLSMIDDAEKRIRSFLKDNPVEKGKFLPVSTKPRLLAQPLIFEMTGTMGSSDEKGKTVVLYDIAGENCVNTAKMERFGEFVTHSDGIILLVSPDQLGFVSETEEQTQSDEERIEPDTVLDTIHQTIVSMGSGKSRIPIAVCLSKSDSIWKDFNRMAMDRGIDIRADRDVTPALQCFNAKEYNKLESVLSEMIRYNAPNVRDKLRTEHETYNYFMISSLGRAKLTKHEMAAPADKTKKSADAKGGKVYVYRLEEDATQCRIMEPFLWLLKQSGILYSNSPIRLPEPRMDEKIKFPIKNKYAWYRASKMLGLWYPGNEYAEMSKDEKESLWYEEN